MRLLFLSVFATILTVGIWHGAGRIARADAPVDPACQRMILRAGEAAHYGTTNHVWSEEVAAKNHFAGFAPDAIATATMILTAYKASACPPMTPAQAEWVAIPPPSPAKTKR